LIDLNVANKITILSLNKDSAFQQIVQLFIEQNYFSIYFSLYCF